MEFWINEEKCTKKDMTCIIKDNRASSSTSSWYWYPLNNSVRWPSRRDIRLLSLESKDSFQQQVQDRSCKPFIHQSIHPSTHPPLMWTFLDKATSRSPMVAQGYEGWIWSSFGESGFEMTGSKDLRRTDWRLRRKLSELIVGMRRDICTFQSLFLSASQYCIASDCIVYIVSYTMVASPL